MKRITDPTFRYEPSYDTNIAKTFARERKRIRDEKEQQAKSASVTPIAERRKREQQ